VRKQDPTEQCVFHQADVGEYLVSGCFFCLVGFVSDNVVAHRERRQTSFELYAMELLEQKYTRVWRDQFFAKMRCGLLSLLVRLQSLASLLREPASCA
jgi:hypothetical protein